MRKRLHVLFDHLRREHADPVRLGWAVGIGVFIGTLPFYGLHLAICIAVAWALRLNKVTVYLAANISNPLFAPALVAAGIAIGEWVRFGELRPFDLDGANGFLGSMWLLGGELPDRFLSCLLGDAILGAAIGIIAGPLAWWSARRWKRTRPQPRDTAADGALATEET